jgi:hypothetical protein
MTEIITFIDHWQTLIGSILGGIFALSTALVVASSATRSARRTAATLLVVDLLSVHALFKTLRRKADEEKVKDEDFPLWVSRRLNWRRPKLSLNFESYAANLVGVHDGLSAHLGLLKMIYSSLDEHLVRLEPDFEEAKSSAPQIESRSEKSIVADAKVVAEGLSLAGTHAEYAIYLLDKLIFAKTPMAITKMRMWLAPKPIEKNSKSLLANEKTR